MEATLWVRLVSEFIATAMMIVIGNGSVANAELKGTKGHKTGWLLIAIGYGCAVMMPAMIFGGISGNHINPAFTIGLAVSGIFPWAEVLPYICAQFLGALFGQFLVYVGFKPFFDNTDDADAVFAPFSTTPAAGSTWNGIFSEFVGSFLLFFGALGITKAAFFNNNQGTAHLALGFLVLALVLSLGGLTGPALNPARDLAPRILHQILPLKHKGSSHWDYAWVPVVMPILASILAVALFKALYL